MLSAGLRLGDCREILRTLPPSSVHCVVTSPPYWGLRDYGLSPVIWGGDPACEHEWRGESVGIEQGSGTVAARANTTFARAVRGTCARCGAWRGVLGLEPTPELYVEHIVEVCREVRRVLRCDGTLWLNMGDCYARSGGEGGGGNRELLHMEGKQKRMLALPGGSGLKPKDLVGMPWRVALALQADGWYLRSDIIWCKPNPMPESVLDRPTRAHEYLFLLVRSERYYYDAEAITESATDAEYRARGRVRPHSDPLYMETGDNGVGRYRSGMHAQFGGHARRNKRSWWVIASEGFVGAHFATFAQALVEPCVLAGTSEWGCCAACGAPWVREIERSFEPQPDVSRARGTKGAPGQKPTDARSGWEGVPRGTTVAATTGWRPSCGCDAAEPVPCVVLDPFVGSGTTAYVAHRLGRRAIGIDANPAYIEMARRRLDALPVGTLL